MKMLSHRVAELHGLLFLSLYFQSVQIFIAALCCIDFPSFIISWAGLHVDVK